jgi:hypothetical protein
MFNFEKSMLQVVKKAIVLGQISPLLTVKGQSHKKVGEIRPWDVSRALTKSHYWFLLFGPLIPTIF